MHAAVYIKEKLSSPLSEVGEVLPRSSWFSRPSSTHFRDVSYSDITSDAETKFSDFMKVSDPNVRFECDMEDKLIEWIQSLTTEELAFKLETTVSTCDADGMNPAFHFTPFQRLLMYVYAHFPVTCTAELEVSSEGIRALTGCESGVRKIPIRSRRTLLKGSAIDIGIFNGPTASGKTAMSLSMGAMLVSNSNFPLLTQEYRAKKLGQVFDGAPDMLVARLVIIATGASVFDHFRTTLLRLKTHLEACMGAELEVWTTVGVRTSIRIAGERPSGKVVFWILPLTKLVTVMRATPEMGVAVVIVDEFTVDTPRVRFQSRESAVLKYIVPIATPQDLTEATRGKSFLSQAFGGVLTSPRYIQSLVQSHRFNDAQRVADQVCILHLSVFTPFRKWLREDLSSLVPPGIRVVFVKSRRLTLSSFLLDSDADFVPASPKSVVFHMLRRHNLTQESVSRIEVAFQGGFVGMLNLEDALSSASIVSEYAYLVNAFHTDRDRILDRLRDFRAECPICSEPQTTRPRIFMCCGYVVCEGCFHRASSTCFFCRAPIEQRVPRSSLPSVVSSPPPPAPPLVASEDLFADLAACTGETLSQLENLLSSLSCLMLHQVNRILVVSEGGVCTQTRDAANERIKREIEGIGIEAMCVDNTFSGKGTAFANMKRRFDSQDPAAVAMCCFDMKDELLVGTNLDRVQALVTIGSIPTKTLTQAMGRIFRPLASRDNSKRIPLLRIYS